MELLYVHIYVLGIVHFTLYCTLYSTILNHLERKKLQHAKYVHNDPFTLFFPA